MPRIDPFQLLKCLSVLLGPTGGIKSKEEVHRLANLMTKFSKKLVSKCIYIQILKTTETELLSQFMDAGGWSLIHMWLADGIVAKNWALIQELLELLLLCPVKIERLKSNNCPKLIKGLSKEVSHQVVRILASHLVEQWLKIVKGECAPNSVPAQIIENLPTHLVTNTISHSSDHYTSASVIDTENQSVVSSNVIDDTTTVQVQDLDYVPTLDNSCPQISNNSTINNHASFVVVPSASTPAPPPTTTTSQSNATSPVCKITIRDGHHVLVKVETDASNINSALNSGRVTNGVDVASTSPDTDNALLDGAVNQVVSCEVKHQTPSPTKASSTPQISANTKSKDDKEIKESNISESNKLSDKENRDSHKSSDKKIVSSVVSSEKKISAGHSSSSKSSSSSSSKHASSSHRSSSHKTSSSSSHRSSSKSSSSKEKSSKDKERHHSGSSAKRSSSSSSSKGKSERDKEREKEKEKLKKDQAEKDRATLEKVQAVAISSKLGKIPRKKPEDDKTSADSSLRKSSTETRDNSKENHKTDAKSAPPAPPEKKHISISIENRKNSLDTSRPKTVKTFNSKFRSTGLEEEVKPPPPRTAVKKATGVISPGDKKIVTPKPAITLKRSSPIADNTATSEKRARLSIELQTTSPTDEKKGAIKLIPAKPKPMVLQESDMFMDALMTASTKSKEPRKRKRKTSLTKDGPGDSKRNDPTGNNETGHESPSQHGSSPQSTEERSPLVVKPNFKFYQDTLETDEDRENKDKSEDPARSVKDEKETDEAKSEADANDDEETTLLNIVNSDIAAAIVAKSETKEDDNSSEPKVSDSPNSSGESADNGNSSDISKKDNKNDGSSSPTSEIRYVDGLRSVLLLQKRKGPKKNLKWKTELESIRYFELDETERVNVTKTFTDMKQMEKQGEREAFQMARKLSTEDLMEEKTRWKPLIPIDLPAPLVEPGKDSREKDIQYAREKGILQALYFNRSMIPDSPSEPDEERHHVIIDPKIIPLEDLTGNKESEKDFTDKAWPEPKPLLIPQLPPVIPTGGFHFPAGFVHSQQPMMGGPPMGVHHGGGPMPPIGQMGPMGPHHMGPQGPIMGPPPPINHMGGPDMGPMPPNIGGGGGGGGGWRTGDGKVVVPDVAMNSMQQGMGGNMAGGFPPGPMDGPMGPPGMIGGPPMFNQQEGGAYGMMGPEDMGFGNYQGPPPGPGMFGPGPNYPGGPPRGGGGPMHGGNRGRGGGPGWFRGGGGGGGGGGWRGGWRGNGKQPPICRQFTKNGFCRVGDKCQYLHPGVNCPPF